MRSIISICLFMLLILDISGQEKNKGYNWPIKPGMTEWKKIQTHEEMLKALQIPNNILNEMGTIELVETCINYPLFLDIWAFNSFQSGVDKVISSFNGFTELQKRKDAGQILLQKYLGINLNDMEKINNALGQGDFAFSSSKIEILLSLPKILLTLTKDERKKILKDVITKTAVMQKIKKFTYENFGTNAFLAIKILSTDISSVINSNLQGDKELETFGKTGDGITMKTINKISELANSYLQNGN